MNFLPSEIRLGRKKGYVTELSNRIEILLDCDVTNALIRIPMTVAQLEKFLSSDRPLMQNLFPELSREVREMLISGTTPAEWQKMFGQKRYTRKELEKFGYEFESE